MDSVRFVKKSADFNLSYSIELNVNWTKLLDGTINWWK